jgi:hypothetical protein
MATVAFVGHASACLPYRHGKPNCQMLAKARLPDRPRLRPVDLAAMNDSPPGPVRASAGFFVAL